MRVCVLGAGVVGVTTAWYLAADGHEVTIIDGGPAVALGASHANGGQISVSHAEPWASPRALTLLPQWLGREDAPLLWRFLPDPAQWGWGIRFLRECQPSRLDANVTALIRLGLYSREALGVLRRELLLDYDQLERGILHIYSEQREFDNALKQAARMREFGCERVPKTAAECYALEPALAASRANVVGGTYTADDESGDARVFTETLARHAEKRGVRFRLGETVRALAQRHERLEGAVLTSGETVRADVTVLALGCWSPLLLRSLGIALPVIPAKGYSATFDLNDDALRAAAPTISLTDDGHRLVFSRLGNRLRVAGTAEFSGYDQALNPARCGAVRQRATTLFPALEAVRDVHYWAGLRPSTPGNVPYVCDMSDHGLTGLWLNTGHGTLGWTLSCGSARLLADLIARRQPDVAPEPYCF